MSVLSAHDYPGNVRELKNLVERLAILCEGPEVSGDEARELLPRTRPARAPGTTPLPPPEQKTAAALRPVGEKPFRDRLEVELALFEFTVAYERLAQELRHPEGERERLLEALRTRVLAGDRRPIDVDVLAAERGMTRSAFGHFFRARTGTTPARFMTEIRIQEAARLLDLERGHFYKKMKALGIRRPRAQTSDDGGEGELPGGEGSGPVEVS